MKECVDCRLNLKSATMHECSKLYFASLSNIMKVNWICLIRNSFLNFLITIRNNYIDGLKEKSKSPIILWI